MGKGRCHGFVMQATATVYVILVVVTVMRSKHRLCPFYLFELAKHAGGLVFHSFTK